MLVKLKENYQIYLDTTKNRISEDLLNILNKKTKITYDQDKNIDKEIDTFIDNNTEKMKVEEDSNNITITKDGQKLTYQIDELKQIVDKMQKIKNNEKQSLAKQVIEKVTELKDKEKIKKEEDSISLTKQGITQNYNYKEIDELKDKINELNPELIENIKEA